MGSEQLLAGELTTAHQFHDLTTRAKPRKDALFSVQYVHLFPILN